MNAAKLRPALDAVIVLLAATLLVILAVGGIDYTWGILRIRLHAVSRPLLLLAGLLAVRAWISTVDGVFVARRGLLALLLATAAIYATYQVRVCGGLDSYGYVSASALLASGHLTEPQPLVQYLPFEGASVAAAPLGYVPGTDGHTEVPRFPLGLPLVMAVFRMFGAMGPFYVPLLMGLATIGVSFLIARQLADSRAIPVAMFAAAIVAVDPLFAYSAMQPMSDVPAACWLLAAVWFRFEKKSSRIRPETLAGVCAGMALLTRPALLVAAIAIGVATLDRPMKETVRYGLALLVFVILQMAVNLMLYGSVRTSGYGPASYMFELSIGRLGQNVSNFGKWLTYSHSWLFWLLWPAALIALRRRRQAWQISLVAAAAGAPYLFYIVFDDWESSRFLLPTILLVLILAAVALGEQVARLKALAGPALLAIALTCASASHSFLRNEGAYRLGELETKYALAGEWIAAHTPEHAVVLAGLHSGSIRYYGHRQTIRWDQIPPDRLSATLRNLHGAGYDTYLVLDAPTEPPLFDSRFKGDAAVRPEPIGRLRVVNFYRFVSTP